VEKLSPSVGMRGGDYSAKHQQRDTQHTEKHSPRRPRARLCKTA
jgi:hypothetical protein